MPNYIKNRIEIIGQKDKVKEVVEFLREKDENMDEGQTEAHAIDFNNITPMPKWVYNKSLSEVQEIKYGEENCWYKWSIKNWGTKWNAIRPSRKDNIIEFETAWSGVPDLIRKLTFIFPEVEIKYSFADEDIGHNLGCYSFKDAEIKRAIFECEEDAISFANALWDGEL